MVDSLDRGKVRRMAPRRVVLAAAALSIAAFAAWLGGLGPDAIPEVRGIRSMTVDAPFQAPEPTAEVAPPAAPGVAELEPGTAPGASAAGSADLLASVDARIALLALVAIVGFGAGLGTLRAALSAPSVRTSP